MAKILESELKPSDEYREAMRHLIGNRFSAVWKAVPVAIEGSDPEGVHDVRVASRRLRAAMDVAVGCFSDRWYRPLHEIAKSITSELGEVRDRDVLLEYLSTDRARVSPEEQVGLDRLIKRVERERDVAREHMLTFLNELEATGIVEESERRFGPKKQSHTSNSGESQS